MTDLARLDEHKPAVAAAPARVRLLVGGPELSLPGGVSEVHRTLALAHERDVDYFVLSYGKAGRLRKIAQWLRVAWNMFRAAPDYDVVLLNPSMTWKSVIRDGLLTVVASLRGCEIVHFWHGWEWHVIRRIEGSAPLRALFRYGFGRSARMLFLTAEFRDTVVALLPSLGERSELVSTTADTTLLDEELAGPPFKRTDARFRLLFLSRVLARKGIFIALRAMALLRRRRDDVDLVLAGSGTHLEMAREFVAEHRIDGVIFPGHVSGTRKHELIKRADVFLFPTWYGEGMPVCVMEALSYGLPVITRRVAALPEIIEDGVQGFLTDSKDPAVFAELVEKLLDDDELRERMARAAVQRSRQFRPAVLRGRLLEVAVEAGTAARR